MLLVCSSLQTVLSPYSIISICFFFLLSLTCVPFSFPLFVYFHLSCFLSCFRFNSLLFPSFLLPLKLSLVSYFLPSLHIYFMVLFLPLHLSTCLISNVFIFLSLSSLTYPLYYSTSFISYTFTLLPVPSSFILLLTFPALTLFYRPPVLSYSTVGTIPTDS